MSWRESPTALVATREIKEATRTKSFRITLLLSAAALAVVIVIANLGNDEPDTETVALVGEASTLADSIEQLGPAAGVELRTITVPDDDAADAALRDGDADVAVSADATTLTTEKEVDLTETSGLADTVNVLRSFLALQNGLRAAGLSPEQAEAVQSAQPPTVDALEPEDADAVDPARIGVALVINILLFIMLQTYGQWVVTAVTREKASRVVEVLLAVIRPKQLLIGKIIGIGIVALGHAAVLLVVGYVTARIMGLEIGAGVGLGDLALAVAWFLLGYALYCSAYAAAGSLVSRVEDAQSVAFPIMLPLLLGYIVSFSAAGGASLLLWIMAFFPPTAILAMPTLYAVGEAPLWAVFLSMAITAVAVVVVAMLAAKIYERSVLRTGKKLSWREAFRLRDEVGQADRFTTAA